MLESYGRKLESGDPEKFIIEKLSRRDAREAEGARLEIVYSANNGIEGSTPSLSAIRVLSSESGVRSC